LEEREIPSNKKRRTLHREIKGENKCGTLVLNENFQTGDEKSVAMRF